MSVRVILCLVWLFSAGGSCYAQGSPALAEYAGQYVMRLGTRNLFVIELQYKSGALDGTMQRPRAFGGSTYIRVTNSATASYTVQSATVAGDHLNLVVRNPQKPSDTDSWDLTLVGAGRATLGPDLPEAAIEPLPLVRVPAEPKQIVATDWDPQHAYGPDDGATSSASMARIFKEDQAPRQSTQISRDTWQDIGKADAVRRQEVKDLLAAGELHTGDDFEKAAFIFQHGSTPEDYLMAHTLAMIAVARGDSSALWIATATLDRYLQSIGKAQIYGTQYRRDSQDKWTQDPYDRSLVPDALRRSLNVPSQAVQQKQLQLYKKQDK